ncbi:hypothetical protein CkaCkLH20_12616 [Colletotrichum karsti]|uniref:Uncharacterized protein n=1 Tax=Colletotrichum karsti TaxID=1095194 RepID=A0A9P6LCW2_9PEZI|nr:uncharacterized protein CkaCkLH20_12616 [Colletotrichum karsti]KAF9869909.1 hypothetical protein CkaCkLH20_12616 [Colletotrichum karsti]
MPETPKRQASNRRRNDRLPLRTVVAKFSSIDRLASEHKREMASKLPTVDKEAVAREIYRFRNLLLEHDEQSMKLAVIDEVDPGHEYLKYLGWDVEVAGEEGWKKSWNAHPESVGQFGTYMRGTVKRWRDTWVEAQAEERQDAQGQVTNTPGENDQGADGSQDAGAQDQDAEGQDQDAATEEVEISDRLSHMDLQSEEQQRTNQVPSRTVTAEAATPGPSHAEEDAETPPRRQYSEQEKREFWDWYRNVLRHNHPKARDEQEHQGGASSG